MKLANIQANISHDSFMIPKASR